MQIDVLSQNTLKLTLSRLDMFDLDIKYESLSGKNPETKRLLSHVLRTVKFDKNAGAGIDFTGERLFVEAFPRPDGGCMLYISCLADEKLRAADANQGRASKNGASSIISHSPRRDLKSSSKNFSENSAENSDVSDFAEASDISEISKSIKNSLKTSMKSSLKNAKQSSKSSSNPPRANRNGVLCKFESITPLKGACASLKWRRDLGDFYFSDALYSNGKEYRLYVSGDNKDLVSALLREYGEIVEGEFARTAEYYNLIIPENAVEKLCEVL